MKASNKASKYIKQTLTELKGKKINLKPQLEIGFSQ